MSTIGLPEIVLVFFVGFLTILPLWKIVGKAGYHPALSLLAFIPLVNVISLYGFAFANWPIQKRSQKQTAE
jgi:hypothetical protein